MRKQIRKSINQAADYWGVTRCTIYRWINAGRLKTERTPGGRQQIIITAEASNSYDDIICHGNNSTRRVRH